MAEHGGDEVLSKIVENLSEFQDTLTLGDGEVTVHGGIYDGDDRLLPGAIVKVSGSRMADRNPMHTELVLLPEQLARLIQRDQRRSIAYGYSHPHESYCGVCQHWQPIKDFVKDRYGNPEWRCKSAKSSYDRQRYASRNEHEGRVVRGYNHRTTARPKTSGRSM